MNNIFRKNKSITIVGIYWQYALDALLTHFFVIMLLREGFPAVAAVSMSFDSLLRVASSVITANLVAYIPSSMRARISIILKSILVLIWFFAVSVLLSNPLSLSPFFFYAFFKIIILFDSYISSSFIFTLRDCFSIEITKTSAMQNILIRASTAIAPALSLAILSAPFTIIVIFVVALVMVSWSTAVLSNKFFALPDTRSLKANDVSFSELLKNPYMRWGILYQILGNLAFAGVSFILLKELKLNAHIFFNYISLLYFSFFVFQVIVFIFGDKAVPINSTLQIAQAMGLCGLGVLMIGLFDGEILRVIFSISIGFTYSLSLMGVQKIVIAKLHGVGYMEYLGWAQMLGRASSFITTIMIGLAMMYTDGKVLLIYYGVFGIIASAILMSLHVKKFPTLTSDNV